MLLGADALTSGSPVYRKSETRRKKRVRVAVRGGVRCRVESRIFPRKYFLQSVTLLNLEFFFLAVIFKVADSTSISFPL
jgi:hypothetical protein